MSFLYQSVPLVFLEHHWYQKFLPFQIPYRFLVQNQHRLLHPNLYQLYFQRFLLPLQPFFEDTLDVAFAILIILDCSPQKKIALFFPLRLLQLLFVSPLLQLSFEDTLDFVFATLTIPCQEFAFSFFPLTSIFLMINLF